MPKRFSDSLKWDDPFFSDLPNEYKLLWIYILDKCDHAGIFKVNKRMAEFCLNTKYDWNDVEGVFTGRIQTLKKEKWFIPKFIEFQYGTLVEANRVHNSIIEILKKEGVYTDHIRSVHRRKDKDKDKDKDKEELATYVPRFKDLNFDRAWHDYLDMRKKMKKPATTRAEELALKELMKWPTNVAIQMLEQSILNSWQGIFPLKAEVNTQKPKSRTDLPPSHSPKGIPPSIQDIINAKPKG